MLNLVPELFPLVLSILALLTLGFVIAYYGRIRDGEVERVWSAIAPKLGLEITHGNLTSSMALRGRYGGHEIVLRPHYRFDPYSEQYGHDVIGHRRVWTRIRVHYEPMGLGLRLHSRKTHFWIREILGRRGVPIGETDFDRQVVMETKDLEGMRELLTSERRRDLLRCLDEVGGLVFHDDHLEFDHEMLVRDVESFTYIMQPLVRAADILALRLRPHGYAAPFPWDAHDVARELFQDDERMTVSEFRARFSRLHIHARLRARGTLRQLQPTSEQSVWDSERTFKAYVDLDGGEGATEPLGTLVVLLPESEEAPFTATPGDEVVFEGLLTRADRHRRQLFLEEAELVLSHGAAEGSAS